MAKVSLVNTNYTLLCVCAYRIRLHIYTIYCILNIIKNLKAQVYILYLFLALTRTPQKSLCFVLFVNMSNEQNINRYEWKSTIYRHTQLSLEVRAVTTFLYSIWKAREWFKTIYECISNIVVSSLHMFLDNLQHLHLIYYTDTNFENNCK